MVIECLYSGLWVFIRDVPVWTPRKTYHCQKRAKSKREENPSSKLQKQGQANGSPHEEGWRDKSSKSKKSSREQVKTLGLEESGGRKEDVVGID